MLGSHGGGWKKRIVRPKAWLESRQTGKWITSGLLRDFPRDFGLFNNRNRWGLNCAKSNKTKNPLTWSVTRLSRLVQAMSHYQIATGKEWLKDQKLRAYENCNNGRKRAIPPSMLVIHYVEKFPRCY